MEQDSCNQKATSYSHNCQAITAPVDTSRQTGWYCNTQGPGLSDATDACITPSGTV